MHDLLRSFAAECAHADETPAAQDAAVVRLLDWFLHTAANARTRICESYGRWFSSTPLERVDPAVVPLTFADDREARAWCDRERLTLVAAVHRAVERHQRERSWQLATMLWHYFYYGSHWRDMFETNQDGLTAARELDDPIAVGQCLNSLAVAARQLSCVDESIVYLEEAIGLWATAGRPEKEAASWCNIAIAYQQARRYQESLQACDHAVTAARVAGLRHLEATALNNRAMTCVRMGDFDSAVIHGATAMEIHRETGDRSGALMTLDTIGLAEAGAGRYDAAIEAYREAITMAGELGVRSTEAEALVNLAHALHAVGQADEAERRWRRGRDILVELDDPGAEHLAAPGTVPIGAGHTGW